MYTNHAGGPERMAEGTPSKAAKQASGYHARVCLFWPCPFPMGLQGGGREIERTERKQCQYTTPSKRRKQHRSAGEQLCVVGGYEVCDLQIYNTRPHSRSLSAASRLARRCMP